MVVKTASCRFQKSNGEPCRATPMRGEMYCFWHHPDHTKEAGEARRLGGLRRRKEKITQGAYDFEGLRSVNQIRRLLEIAAMDALALENSIARSRTLAYLAQVAAKLLEVGEIEERLNVLEGYFDEWKEKTA